jgi:hypothetical protein
MPQLCWISRAALLSSSKGTYSSAFSWVARGRREVRHQHRAPPSSAWRTGTSDCRPGKPISGTGVLRSFPAGFAEGKELFRDFDADHVGYGVLGAGLAAAGAVESSHRPDGARVQSLAEDVSILWHDQPHRTLHSASNWGAGRGQEAALILSTHLFEMFSASPISLTEAYTLSSSIRCHRHALASALTSVPSGCGFEVGAISLPSRPTMHLISGYAASLKSPICASIARLKAGRAVQRSI